MSEAYAYKTEVHSHHQKSTDYRSQYSGQQALKVLKENIYKYYSREDRNRLDELGCRLTEEGLLHSLDTQKLIDLFERYSDGDDTLDGVITSLRFQGKHPTNKLSNLRWSSHSLAFVVGYANSELNIPQ